VISTAPLQTNRSKRNIDIGYIGVKVPLPEILCSYISKKRIALWTRHKKEKMVRMQNLYSGFEMAQVGTTTVPPIFTAMRTSLE